MILELWNFAGAGGDGDGAGPRAYRRLHAVGEVLGWRVAGLTNHRTVISTDRRRHQRQRAGLQQADLSRFARRKQLRRSLRSTGRTPLSFKHSGTGLCSYRVRGVEHCSTFTEHLTVESYTVFICQ